MGGASSKPSFCFIFYSLRELHVQCMQIYRKLAFHVQIVQKV